MQQIRVSWSGFPEGLHKGQALLCVSGKIGWIQNLVEHFLSSLHTGYADGQFQVHPLFPGLRETAFI